MKYIKVPGKYKKHKVLIYAISTCIWCKKVKYFLDSIKVEYDYVFTDLLEGEDRQLARENITEYTYEQDGDRYIIKDFSK